MFKKSFHFQKRKIGTIIKNYYFKESNKEVVDTQIVLNSKFNLMTKSSLLSL